MTSIRDRILARQDLADARAARDLDALAAGLNAQPESVVQSRFVTARAVMAGCADGIAILDALNDAAVQNSAVAWAVKFLGQEAGLDVGDPYTQSMIDELVKQNVLSQVQAEQLKALALRPVLVTRADVEAAMFNPDGTEK